MKKLLTLVVIILSISYPFVVYFGLQKIEGKWLIPFVFSILALRWCASGESSERNVILITLLVMGCVIMFAGQQLGLKFYPVMMNLSFFVLFAGSLFTATPIVEKFARLKEPELPNKAVVYTRKVTVAWSIFFVFNGSIACFTALFSTDEVWMLYNGLVAYVLMGILGISEWLIRQHVIKA
ncbi:COG4648 family protein [Aliiglaciecola aliphaticivorans]